jgi:hypothetical protein
VYVLAGAIRPIFPKMPSCIHNIGSTIRGNIAGGAISHSTAQARSAQNASHAGIIAIPPSIFGSEQKERMDMVGLRFIVLIVLGMAFALMMGVLVPQLDDVIGFLRGRIAAPLIGWLLSQGARWHQSLKQRGWA